MLRSQFAFEARRLRPYSSRNIEQFHSRHDIPEEVREAIRRIRDTGTVIRTQSPTQLGEERVLALRFLQGRKADWTYRPFFARYDESATWLNELEPAGNAERFFFQDELDAMIESG